MRPRLKAKSPMRRIPFRRTRDAVDPATDPGRRSSRGLNSLLLSQLGSFFSFSKSTLGVRLRCARAIRMNDDPH